MSALTIIKALAKNVGMTVPNVVFTSSDRELAVAAQLANETGEELARRVDWGGLQATTTLTGDGTNKTFALPSDFSRLNRGAAVLSGITPLRPVSRAEWTTMTAAEGTPRYFLLGGDEITLWPYLATGETVTVNYQSKDWSSAGEEFTADSDTALVDENLLLKGLVVRWRRLYGLPYQDFEAEYEATIADFADFDSRGRF